MFEAKVFPYRTLSVYPGMRPQDVAIWESMILTMPGLFTNVWYNVELGDPTMPGTSDVEARANGMRGVSTWRVDVIGETAEGLWATEIKPDARAGAIGQAMAYAKLIEEQYRPGKPVLPLVVSDDVSPITRHAAQLLNVHIIEVDSNFRLATVR